MTAALRRRRRSAEAGDDRGSIAFAVLLTIVGISLSVLLTPMVIGQRPSGSGPCTPPRPASMSRSDTFARWPT
jgi:hypothetical protein